MDFVASEKGKTVLIFRMDLSGMTKVLFVIEGRLVEWLEIVCAEIAVLLVVGLGQVARANIEILGKMNPAIS